MVILQRTKKNNTLTEFLFITILLVLIGTTCAAAANQEVGITADVPYSLATKITSVQPGGKTQIRIVAENYGSQEKVVNISVQLPPEVKVLTLPEGWVLTSHPSGTYAQTKIRLSRGYGQWFELMPLQCAADILPGLYPITVSAITDDGYTDTIKAMLPVERVQISSTGGLTLEKVILPLQHDGKADLRMSADTLVAEDNFLAGLKVLLSGRGVTSTLEEQARPIAYMGVDFANPQAQQVLVVVRAFLLDKNTKQLVPGLISAAGDPENSDGVETNGSSAMFALHGDKVQRVIVPLYTDEKLGAGEYILQVVAQEMDGKLLTHETTVNVITRNSKAALFTVLSLVLVAASTIWGLLKWRTVKHGFKTRWLVTISLFGTAGFAVVNVPHTFLNDIFHILLGPFGFLVTGMFNGIILYMLIVCLLVLIPRPGTAALMTVVRMLLSMLAFGHISPVGLLIYGSQAVFLEGLLYLTGITRNSGSLSNLSGKNAVRKAMFAAALTCGIADAAATYVNLNALAFLYRLYYAEWYISLCVLINGFLYPAIGAASGVMLGKQMREVGGE